MKIGNLKFSLSNIKAFIQGNVRMFVDKHGSTFTSLPEHIKEQIVFREAVANPTCKANGICKCECKMPGLLYADKTCHDECYPEMMDELKWEGFKLRMESMRVKQEYPLPRIWKSYNASISPLVTPIESEVFFDTITNKSSVEVNIEYYNGSANTVILEKFETSCGCSTPHIENKVVEAGQSLNVKVVIDGSKRKVGKSSIATTAKWSDGTQSNVLISGEIVEHSISDVPKYVIYLDAGHGGVDVDGRYTTRGKSFKHSKGEFHDGTMFYEGVSNRLSADILKPMLESEGFEVVVIYEPVADISLTERVNRANSHWRNGKRPGLLISLHSNAVSAERAGQARGFLVYTSVGETPSDVIAHDLLDEYEKIFPNLRVRRDSRNSGPDYEANFTMLSRTVMPAILPENLFFDNYDDAVLLMSKEYHKGYCQALVNTCIKARNRYYGI